MDNASIITKLEELYRKGCIESWIPKDSRKEKRYEGDFEYIKNNGGEIEYQPKGFGDNIHEDIKKTSFCNSQGIFVYPKEKKIVFESEIIDVHTDYNNCCEY